MINLNNHEHRNQLKLSLLDYAVLQQLIIQKGDSTEPFMIDKKQIATTISVHRTSVYNSLITLKRFGYLTSEKSKLYGCINIEQIKLTIE